MSNKDNNEFVKEITNIDEDGYIETQTERVAV